MQEPPPSVLPTKKTPNPPKPAKPEVRIATVMFTLLPISLLVYLLKQTYADHLHNHGMCFIIWAEALAITEH